VRPSARARDPQALLSSIPRGAAAVGRGVGAEAQPVRPGRGLEVVEHHPRLDRGPGRLRVQRQHPPEVPAQVHDHARTDGVAGDRGAGAPGRHRDAYLQAGDDDRGLGLLEVTREDDQLGRYPVQRGVGRVLGPPPGGRVDLGDPAHRRAWVSSAARGGWCASGSRGRAPSPGRPRRIRRWPAP
jgi:hypothetical protein